MEPEVDRLITFIKKRRHKALEQVMDRYLHSVYGVAKCILGSIASEQDIEECVQDVFIDVWNQIDRYNPDRGSFKTWILILCKYKALSMKKRIMHKNKTVNLDEVNLDTGYSMDERLLSKEGVKEIVDTINAFNPIDRELFLRRYILEHSIDDICEAIDLSRQAVDNRLWRGRKVIRETLQSFEREGYE